MHSDDKRTISESRLGSMGNKRVMRSIIAGPGASNKNFVVSSMVARELFLLTQISGREKRMKFVKCSLKESGGNIICLDRCDEDWCVKLNFKSPDLITREPGCLFDKLIFHT